MTIKTLKTNYILSILRLGSNVIFGLITMPYINRILSPENLGKVEYSLTIVNFFTLISSIGIPIYGIKVVSQLRSNMFELSKATLELVLLLTISSLFIYLILFSTLFYTSFLTDYKNLIILLSLIIVLSNLGLEWLYQGLEDQLYITIRTLFVRFLALVILYVLVKDNNDYIWYALVTMVGMVGGNVLNLIYLRKNISFKSLNINVLDIKKHIKPTSTIFIGTLAVSLYSQIDAFLLGYLTTDKDVGLYSTANKLVRYSLVFLNTLGVIILPRVSNYWHHGNHDDYYILITKTLNVILLSALPITIYIFIFADDIIKLMAGNQYLDAIITLRILSGMCLLAPLVYYLAFLILCVQDYEKYYTYIVIFGAGLSICLNLIFIPKYLHMGAAFTQVIIELLICIALAITVFRKKLIKNFLNRDSLVNLLKVFLVNLILLFLSKELLLHNYSIINFVIYSACFFILYFVLLIVFHIETIIILFKPYIQKYF